MNTDSQMKIQELWKNEQCPEINGVIFGNGVVKEMNIVRDNLWKFIKIESKPENQTTVTDFLATESDKITTIYQLCDKPVINRNIRLVAGEADWGSFGFVAVENLQTKELLFMLFFDNSNPFVEIDFFDSNIIATNNLGEKWTIPVKEPEKLKVFES